MKRIALECGGKSPQIVTRECANLDKAARALQAGPVWINTHDQPSNVTPFGGYKHSGIGRDRSLHALDKYTEIKTTWL